VFVEEKEEEEEEETLVSSLYVEGNAIKRKISPSASSKHLLAADGHGVIAVSITRSP